jgi:hypothetical protein
LLDSFQNESENEAKDQGENQQEDGGENFENGPADKRH